MNEFRKIGQYSDSAIYFYRGSNFTNLTVSSDDNQPFLHKI